MYPPTEVTTPHPTNHVLTIFQPHPPAAGERFPTIIWSGANAYQTGVPPAADPEKNIFLFQALCRGWAVVTVGTNGISSCPTPGQPVRCNDPNMACAGMPGGMGCEDYSLWYGQDTTPGSPWNDFNYFIGEKDFFWACQYVVDNADDFAIDTDRIILSGVSTGAIYSVFVAYEAQPWGSSFSLQTRISPKIAGLVLFESVAWLPGYDGETASGEHWPLASISTSSNYVKRSPKLWEVAGNGMGPAGLLRARP